MKGKNKNFDNHSNLISLNANSSSNNIETKSDSSEKKDLNNNIDFNVLNSKFKPNECGLFGVQGKNVRVIYTKNPDSDALDFFNKISETGISEQLKNGHGIIAKMPNDDLIVYRPKTSTPNSPAITITIKNQGEKVKSQKIHFIKSND